MSRELHNSHKDYYILLMLAYAVVTRFGSYFTWHHVESTLTSNSRIIICNSRFNIGWDAHSMHLYTFCIAKGLRNLFIIDFMLIYRVLYKKYTVFFRIVLLTAIVLVVYVKTSINDANGEIRRGLSATSSYLCILKAKSVIGIYAESEVRCTKRRE